jgi:SNF2 family DNA or RNA helicase
VAGLRDHNWKPAYSHEDGDLVKLFYVPSIERSVRYDRVTGYFSGGALSLAARGLDRLIERGGKMRLVVGCTLGEREVEQIEKGYQLRDLVETGWADRLSLSVEDDQARKRLGWLAWMVANGHLDIKLAVPKDEKGHFHPGLGLYHAKCGLLTDEAGDQLSFTGSINETLAGWVHNVESFTVSCSWRGEWDLLRVERAESEFRRLWMNVSRCAEVIDFPEAVRTKLLDFMPKDDVFVASPQGDAVPDQPLRGASLANDKDTPYGGAPEPKPETPSPEPEQTPVEEAPVERPDADELRKRVWSFIRNAPSRPDGALVAIETSTITPWPHQLRAYKRMLDNWPFRLLIADEVGLGKTIEAGMIVRHAWISGLAKRILIMVPAGIIKQWQAELYEKFNLLVPIYTGKSLVLPEFHFREQMAIPRERKVARDAWTEEPFVLVSSQLMRMHERQQELVDAEGWDLLVLDEAHHARRRGAGTPQERGANLLLELMHKLKDKAKSLLLMTATPMQVAPVEIWDLLAILGIPPEWTDKAFQDHFESLAKNPDDAELHRLAGMFRANESAYGPIPDGEVDRVAEKYGLGPADRKNVLSALRSPSRIPLKRLSTTLRQAAIALLKLGTPVRARMSRHTRNLLREYHARGLLDSPIAERDVDDIAVEMAPQERAVYEAVEDYIRTTYQAATPDKKTAVGFVMTVYRRRMASSFHALRKTLENRLDALSHGGAADDDEERLAEDVAQDESADEVMSGDDAAKLASEALAVEERSRIQELLKAVARLGTDTKALRLVHELKTVLASGYDTAIVFTQYTDTLDYLKDFLAERLDLPIGCFSGRGGQRRDASGSWSPCTKEEIKRLLREEQIRILVCNDAAGEGLNLQTAGALFNSDLPWNPMKVEQRIGRIDRIGQKHEKVRIVNFGYKDTVETDVYFALQERIGLFKGVVGKLQPILSQIPRQFEAAALMGPEQGEKARQEALSNIHKLVDEAEVGGFDIDEVSEADLRPPEFPPSPLEPADLDLVLRREELLPPGVECRELEPSTYALRVPGCAEEARVTTSPAVFDEHFQSHQMMAFDGPLFARAAGAHDGESEESSFVASSLAELLGEGRDK